MARRELAAITKSLYYSKELEDEVQKASQDAEIGGEWRFKPVKIEWADSIKESSFTGPSGLEIFTHETALKPEDGESMRLLELLPGRRADVIECKLQVVALSAKPTYEALSYCWGDATDLKPIQVNDKIFNITPNLRSALRHFRHPTDSRSLWIDAICMNQQDLDEKSWQLSLMPQFYRSSAKTLIWLGSSSNYSHEAFPPIRVLARAEAENKHDPVNEIEWAPEERHLAQGVLTLESGPSWTHEIEVILNRPWFKRVWVVQEAILSPDAEIWCGLSKADWHTFRRAVHYAFERKLILHYMDRMLFTYKAFRSEIFIPTAKSPTSGKPAELLLAYLMEYRDREAKLPVDKIFSLLGLVQDVDTIGIRKDYRLSVDEVYRTTTVQILRQLSHLDVLGAAGLSVDEDPPSTSSWVADWRSETSLTAALGHASEQYASATNSSTSHDIRFEEGDRMMVLSGHRCGRIQAASVVLSGHSRQYMAKRYTYDSIASSLQFESWRDVSQATRLFTDTFKAKLQLGSEIMHAVLEWEKFAGVHDDKKTSNTDYREYWQTLCAERYIEDDERLTEQEFLEWHRSMAGLRTQAKLPILRDSLFITELVRLRSIWTKWPLFMEALRIAYGRRLAKVDGRLALVPQAAKVGDEVLLCRGARVPLTARRNGSNWILIGEAYVNGMMQGQAFDDKACQDLRFE